MSNVVDSIKKELPELELRIKAKSTDLMLMHQRRELFQLIISTDSKEIEVRVRIADGGPYPWLAYFYDYEKVVNGWGSTQLSAIMNLYDRLGELASKR